MCFHRSVQHLLGWKEADSSSGADLSEETMVFNTLTRPAEIFHMSTHCFQKMLPGILEIQDKMLSMEWCFDELFHSAEDETAPVHSPTSAIYSEFMGLTWHILSTVSIAY